MTEIKKPTCNELIEEDGFKRVHHEADDSWRHGCYVTDVFQRESDGTFWMANYRRSADGETNELREGDAEICQVEPKEVKKIKYVAVQPAAALSE